MITLQVSLAPGAPAGFEAVNQALTTSAEPDFEISGCDSIEDQPVDEVVIKGVLYCRDEAIITSLEGTSFDANKWSAGADSFGFLNTLTGEIVSTSDPTCPRIVQGDRTYTRYPCVARNFPGQGFDFILRLTNASNNAAGRAVKLMDTLPVVGDRGIILNDQSRGTQWSTPPHLLGPPRELTSYGLGSIRYTTSDTVGQDICFELSGSPDPVPAGCTPADWTGDVNEVELDEVTAFDATWLFTRFLLPGQTAVISLRMDSPLDLEDPQSTPVAWNSFAQEDYLFTTTGRLTLPATEPIKAGIAVVYGKVAVEKVVTGNPPEGPDLSTFPVDYECTATQEQPGGAQGPRQVVASGTVQVPAGQTVDVPDLLPAGAVCTFWEPDTLGAVSNADGKVNAQRVVVLPTELPGREPTPAQVVRITNDYPLGSLELTRELTGSGAQFATGPFTFDVACTFLGTQTVTEQVILTAPDELSASVEGINVGAECTITEQEPYGGADGPATFSPEGPYVITSAEDGPVQVTATNEFTAGALVIEKVVENAEPDAGPFTFQATCVAADGTPVELPDGGQVDIFGGEQVGTEVPLGSSCTVVEVDVPDEVSVSIEDSDPSTPGGATDGVVVITAAASVQFVSVTNLFPEVIEGGTTDPLARTGAGTSIDWLLVSLGLLVTGGVLTFLSRRRRSA